MVSFASWSLLWILPQTGEYFCFLSHKLLKFFSASDRPVDRAGLDSQHFFNIVQQIKRILASRSILLIKVKIGICRITHTLNSLMVCGSTPLDASMTMTAQSAASGYGTYPRKVLMSRRIQDIDTFSFIFKLQHG